MCNGPGGINDHIGLILRFLLKPLIIIINWIEWEESKSDRVLDNLISWLKRYNSFIYRPGKHDFRLPYNRRGHRFTSREVVLTAFVTINLANRIREITKCSPELNCHCGD